MQASITCTRFSSQLDNLKNGHDHPIIQTSHPDLEKDAQKWLTTKEMS
jgi:hypothetical protein